MANRPSQGAAGRPKAWVVVAIALGIIAIVIVNWPASTVDVPPRKPLPASELRALPDDAVVPRANDQLRWFLTIDRTRMATWRSLPEPARHLLVIGFVEGETGLPSLPSFGGLSGLFTNGSMAITGQELAEAYRAIGASACAAVAADAHAAAGDAKRLAACDRRLVEASRKDGAFKRLTSWVRDHADDLAAVWARP